MKSSLARISATCREPDPANARQAAYEAWHRHGVFLCRPEWFHGWAERKQAELLAERLFGRRT